MDQAIRNKLRNVVTQCRKRLEDAVAQVLQGQFGIYASGKKDEVHVEDVSRMGHLGAEDSACRSDLLDHFEHIKSLGYKPTDALAQLVREIAFTHLNRLCAYKMMEAREVWVGGQKFREAVSRGLKSQGFLFYLAQHPEDEKLHNTGHQDVAYRHFLDWLGGTLSEEIGVLFSPNDPANRLYPPQRVLEDVIDLLNGNDIKAEDTELREQWPSIWSQDETLGWVYQYFTPKELRDQVRKESAAPRNSYELAFRNQFFTPRYVVEFLTDNTLGRIWYEMRKGATKLKEQCRYMVRRPNEVFLAQGQEPPKEAVTETDLSQEELLKQPVYIPHRPKKDPRELKMLDPACGSAHFPLYCFDLLTTIYEESYNDPDLSEALKNDYPTLEALRKDVPRLILAHNLYGIDIDKRATQIAALALWLRCQRAYKEMGITNDRPKITRCNMVCAEPMPGEKEMLKEFTAELQPKLLGHLVEVVFDKMKLAGEAGSLLKIEEELREAIASAKQQWAAEHERAVDKKGRPMLFSQAEMDRTKKGPHQPQLFDVSEITEEQFWNEAESRVADALREYAAHATNGGRLRRQLFAEDASHGFAFVDVCQKRFDVVLMNPPFGEASKPGRTYLEQAYPQTKTDLYAAFVERGLWILDQSGGLGAITSRTGFFLGSFQKWREDVLLKTCSPTAFADLGYGVLDTAMVETAAYCLTRRMNDAATPFLRLLSCEDKSAVLQETASAFSQSIPCAIINAVRSTSFSAIPGSPFVYWVSQKVRSLFSSMPPLESQGRENRVGLQTSDNHRFLRCWWEIPPKQFKSKWVPYAKGGGYSPYYRDVYLCVNWEEDGREIKDFARQLGNSPSRSVRSEDHYFRAALTYSDRCTGGFATSPLPKGCIFDVKGSAIFVPGDEPTTLLTTQAVTLSNLFRKLMALRSGTHSLAQSFQVGQISSTPFPIIPVVAGRELAQMSQKAWATKRSWCRMMETDHYFVCPPMVADAGKRSLHDASVELEVTIRAAQEEVETIQLQLDDIVGELYGLLREDVQGLLEADEGTQEADNTATTDDEEDGPTTVITASEWTIALAQWSVGIIAGRWDIRWALSARDCEDKCDPFSSLPACPPGMLRLQPPVRVRLHSLG